MHASARRHHAAPSERLPRRRQLVLLLLLLFLLGCAGLTPSTSRALDYVESSPVGSSFPSWDGGDTGLRFADIDADGHVDFLSIGDHGSPYINTDQHGIMVYFGDGHGGWSIHMEGNFGYGGIAVGDVDGDGLLDVGYGMHHDYSSSDLGDQLIEVALGDGTGTAWTPWDDGLATSGESWGMMATDLADFDNDGDLDLVSGSFGCCNGVHVYRNEGDGTWTQTYALSGGNSESQLACGDIDGDGNADFAASYQYGTVFVGDGEGGFTVADSGLPPAGSLGRIGVALGDVDGDGGADLSYTSGGGVLVHLWRGDHWESASSGLPASGGYALTALRDLDVDGQLDVLALGSGTCSIWLGDGGTQWSAGGGFTAGSATSTAALDAGGDIDHNGLPDVVLVQREGSWPSDHNVLHVYREATPATSRRIAVTFPRGNETFIAGSVQTLRWSAAQVGDAPAVVSLELSTTGPGGPWTPIAADIGDGGHHQWTVSGAPGATTHVRATLTQDGETVVGVSPAFRILPATTTGVADDRIGAPGWMSPHLRLLGNPVHDRARLRIVDATPCAGATSDERAIPCAGAAATPPATWTVAVFESSGRLVRRLPVGASELWWDLRNSSGAPVTTGIYWLVLEPGTTAERSRRGGETGQTRRPAARRLVVLR